MTPGVELKGMIFIVTNIDLLPVQHLSYMLSHGIN